MRCISDSSLKTKGISHKGVMVVPKHIVIKTVLENVA